MLCDPGTSITATLTSHTRPPSQWRHGGPGAASPASDLQRNSQQVQAGGACPTLTHRPQQLHPGPEAEGPAMPTPGSCFCFTRNPFLPSQQRPLCVPGTVLTAVPSVTCVVHTSWPPRGDSGKGTASSNSSLIPWQPVAWPTAVRPHPTPQHPTPRLVFLRPSSRRL